MYLRRKNNKEENKTYIVHGGGAMENAKTVGIGAAGQFVFTRLCQRESRRKTRKKEFQAEKT